MALPTSVTAGDAPSRRRRLRALALDLAVGVALHLGMGLLAVAWLMVRTRGGEVDVAPGDAALAFALVMAALPAWLGWLAADLVGRSSTRGQRASGLAVAGSPLRRVARLALHPFAVLGWLWLAAVAELALLPTVSLLLLAAAVLVAAAAVTSGAIAIGWPSTVLIHDRVAGTRLTTSEAPRA